MDFIDFSGHAFGEDPQYAAQQQYAQQAPPGGRPPGAAPPGMAPPQIDPRFMPPAGQVAPYQPAPPPQKGSILPWLLALGAVVGVGWWWNKQGQELKANIEAALGGASAPDEDGDDAAEDDAGGYPSP